MAENKTDKADQIARLVQVAHLYYDENLSQQEIADKLEGLPFVNRAIPAASARPRHCSD